MIMTGQTLIMITQENLDQYVAETTKRLVNALKASDWVTPEEAEKLLNVKRQTILKLWEKGDIDLTWIGQDNTKVWQACRKSIEKYLEKKRNYNTKNSKKR